MTSAKRRRLWQARVGDYLAGELSVREWCEKNRVSANALRYWLGKIGGESASGSGSESSEQRSPSWSGVEIVEDGMADEVKLVMASENPESARAWGEPRVSVRVGATDMRKSIDGLAAIVTLCFELDVFSESWFVFCNRGRDKLKILRWDTNGFWLYAS